MVITIGEVNQSNLKRKGLENFVKVANFFPGIPFVLIGQWALDGTIDFLKSIATRNVRFTGYLSPQELGAYMEKATVYAQLSYHEAFGAALAEAMLHCCIPVVTAQYALPEVAGETGYLVPLGDIPATVDAIRSALQNPEKGQKARERVLSLFALERRRDKLNALIKGLFN